MTSRSSSSRCTLRDLILAALYLAGGRLSKKRLILLVYAACRYSRCQGCEEVRGRSLDELLEKLGFEELHDGFD